MVDLPKVSRRLVTTEAPQSGLSARDIAAPYAAMAEAAREGGAALESVAESGVEDAAARAVTVDADGNVNVERTAIPMVGKVGKHYERLVRTGAVVQADAIADRDLLDLRQESRGNPAAFMSAAEAYRDQRVGQLSATVGDAGGAALRRQIDNRITASYGSLLAEHQNIEIKRNNEAIDSRLLTLSNEAETLARRNGVNDENGNPSPEFQTRLGNIRALLDEKVNNPLLAFPKEKADAFMDQLTTRVQGAAILEQTERVYRARGFEAARTYLRESARGLEGKVKEVDKIERGGLAWLRSEESGFRAERLAVGSAWNAMRANAAIEPRENLIALEEQAIAVGDHRTAMNIRTTRAALDLNAEIRNLPVAEQARLARGGSVGLVDKIAGREQGATPDATNPNSSATGDGQFIKDTWRDLIRRHRPDLMEGKTDQQILDLRKDPKLSREMIGIYAKENGDRLAAANVPVNDGNLYLAHFLGPGDAIKVLKAPPGTPVQGLVSQASIDANAGVFQRNPTAGQIVQWAGVTKGGGAAADTATSRAGSMALTMLKKDLAKDLSPRLDAIGDRIRQGQIPAADEMAEVGAVVAAVGTPAQRRKAAEYAVMAEVGDRFQSLSGPERDAAISAMDAKLRAGGSQAESDMVQTLRTQDKAIGDLYKTDPYAAFVKYGRGDAAVALPPIDFGNPAQAAQILDAKVKQQAVFRDQEGLGPVSALRPSEAEAFRNTIVNGDGQVAGGAFQALSQLPREVFAETVAMPAVKQAIDGASRSYDPAKMTAAMSMMDAMRRADPAQFQKTFGPDTERRLGTWLAWKDSAGAAEIVERFKRVDDPAFQSARKALQEQAKTELKSWAPSSVVGAIDAVNRPVGSWVPFTGPSVPGDTLVATALKADFDRFYSDLRESGVEPGPASTQAAQRMKGLWIVSDVAGGQFMRNPPERHYPQVGGSHDWMRPQLDAYLADAVGKPRLGFQRGDVGPGTTENWALRGVVADAETESDIAAGRPPSYKIVLTDNASGQVVAVDKNLQPLRFRWDAAAPQAAEHQRIDTMEERANRQNSFVEDKVRLMQERERRMSGDR